MGDEQNRFSDRSPNPGEVFVHRFAGDGIECTEWLVHEQNRRIHRQSEVAPSCFPRQQRRTLHDQADLLSPHGTCRGFSGDRRLSRGPLENSTEDLE
jgi:hypothetical protein